MKTVGDIAHLLGLSSPLGFADRKIAHLAFDSRRLSFPASTLFFALPGNQVDGHDYIHSAYASGVRSFVVARSVDDLEDAAFLVVEDVLAALQTIAATHREQFTLPVVGITGSNGKTIIKEWLFELLQSEFNICRSPKSYNSQIGVPLSVWQLSDHHDLALFEAGISRKGEMEKLTPIINCTVGIFTNIGAAHDEGFATRKEKAIEKAKLFAHGVPVVFCANYDHVIDGLIKSNPYGERLTWAFAEGCPLPFQHDETTWFPQKQSDLLVTDYEVLPMRNRTRLSLKWAGKNYDCVFPFSNFGLVENALHCLRFMLHLGYEITEIEARLQRLQTLPMRLELIKGRDDIQIINDSYSADYSSLEIALDFQKSLPTKNERVVVLSDLDQTGLSADVLAEKVAALLQQYQIKELYTVGEASASFAYPGLSKHVHLTSTTEFRQLVKTESLSGKSVLIKGARRFEFETIARQLSRKLHDTVLEVNLAAIQHNLSVYSRFLHTGVRKMLMVKADAYGLGAPEIAATLAFEGVDYLAVAYADEGVELRKAGIRLPIMVLRPEAASVDVMVEHQLEPEIFTTAQLIALIESQPNNEMGIHLKFDTGMHRLGFEPDELDELFATLREMPQIKVRSIFTHLAASDEPDQDAFSAAQLARFEKMYELFVEQMGYRPWRHVLNSSGILRFPEHQYEMVRLGLGLYGIDPSGRVQNELRTVQRMTATISQIKTIAAGETVGYSRKGKVAPNSRIATISIGYADGLWRSAGNGQYAVQLHGKSAPIVGNVCMDMTMIDITKIPQARPGDQVVIYDSVEQIQQLATLNGTIPYEVFTAVSSRVKRVYVHE